MEDHSLVDWNAADQPSCREMAKYPHYTNNSVVRGDGCLVQ